MNKLATNELITKALHFAARAHKGDTRKGKEVPYIVHPVEVALTLQKYGKSEELIAAGLLHDILEDTEITEEELREEFNDRITDLVISASEELEGREDRPWEERKEQTINYLQKAPWEVKYLACADKLSNIRSMIRDYGEIGDELWAKFNRGYKKQKWYYVNLVISLKELEGIEIYEQFKLAVDYLFKS